VANVICLSFEGALHETDLARALFEQFAAPAWADLEAAHLRGEISLEEYHARAFDLIEAPEADLLAFARQQARPRPGVLELVDWAHWHGWQVIVLSHGFDLYVDAILEGLGLDRVVRHCGRAKFVYRWRVRYLSPRGVEVQDRFKLGYVAALREAGDFVVYVAGSPSDLQAAAQAQVVFAPGSLSVDLKAGPARVYPFETLHDAVAVLDREAESWLASSSSTTAAEG
jgi:2-hydroxy-3-keto-5-methylthiopentenyl-1-phosphate phosphatase